MALAIQPHFLPPLLLLPKHYLTLLTYIRIYTDKHWEFILMVFIASADATKYYELIRTLGNFK